jgi:exopolysaccharide biosynthesis WecB/TagA/CpsF family protein
MSEGSTFVEVLGVQVVRMTAAEALMAVERAVDSSDPSLIAYANAHTLNLAASDPSYRGVLRQAAVVLNDGAGIAIAARLKGSPFPENLNGSDFNPKILELAARRGWSAYFLGAAPGVADRAAERLTARIPGLQIAGCRDGFFPRSADAEVAAQIKATGADLVMVAMGNPLQERWIASNLPATGCRAGIGVGAFFDFAAEQVARAPAWMNRLGVEWVWRLAQEPGRLWRRYVLGNPRFLLRVLAERRTGRD